MSSFEQRPFTRSQPASYSARGSAEAPVFVETPNARRPQRVGRTLAESEETSPMVSTTRALSEDDFEGRLAEARAEGRAEGSAAADARFAAEAKRALGALEAALVEARAREGRALAELAHRSLSLAAEIAERVLKRAVANDLAALAPCVEEALAALAPESAATLTLAPADLAQLRAGGAAALLQLAERAQLALREDVSLARGEVALAAGAARIELRWGAIAERMRAALEEQLPLAEAQS